jgi:hypothetical protein
MSYEEIVAKVAEDNGLSKKFVDKVYKAYWKAVREYIKALPLKKDLTDEEFLELRPNVNIPSIGKLYVTLDNYKKKKKKFKRLTSKEYVAYKRN